jgi:hypothetical protein
MRSALLALVPAVTFLAATLAPGAAPAQAHEAAPAGPSKLKGERPLSDEQRAAVMKELHACWVAPAKMPPDADLTLLVVMSDSNRVMDATIAPEDQDRADTPEMRGFARSALNAATDRRCSQLDIPNGSTGRDWLFRLHFTP